MNVLIAVHETGSANALVPVIQELDTVPNVQLKILGTGYASSVFLEEGIPHQEIELSELKNSEILRTADRLLREVKPDLLILGTAWEKNLEKAFLELAPARGIRSLTIVDNWSHFQERFVGLTGRHSVFPDRVAVIDDCARRQALKEGVPDQKLVITGQPHLESIAQRFTRPEVMGKAAQLRRQWLTSAPAGTRLVLFVSEPFAVYSGPSTPYYRGYTEKDALGGLLEARETVEKKRGIPIRVVAKLHPRESASDFSKEWGARIQMGKEGQGLASIAASDAIVGMASMLLLESAIAGRPTISFEPNGKEEVAFHGAQIGGVAKASNVLELASWLDAVLTKPVSSVPRALAGLVRGGAASKIVEAAMELVSDRQGAAR